MARLVVVPKGPYAAPNIASTLAMSTNQAALTDPKTGGEATRVNCLLPNPAAAYRGSSLGRHAARSTPSGSLMGVSLRECTPMSMLPAATARSITSAATHGMGQQSMLSMQVQMRLNCQLINIGEAR